MKPGQNKHRKHLNVLSGRSAQIHLSETVAVIFIFFVLILFGAIFYYKLIKKAIIFGKKRKAATTTDAIAPRSTTAAEISLAILACSLISGETRSTIFSNTVFSNSRVRTRNIVMVSTAHSVCVS